MTWTYTPVVTPRDEIRLLIGDTVSGQQATLNDEEIAYLLDKAGDVVDQAAYDAAIQLAGQFARMATSKSVGDMSLTYSERARELRAVAADIKARRATLSPPTPWIHPDALKVAKDRLVPGATGTEFWTGQSDNTSG